MNAEPLRVTRRVTRFIVHRSSFIVCLFLLCTSVSAQTVRITDKPSGLVHGILYVPIVASEPVTKLVLLINGVKWAEAPGRVATVQVNVGEYIRRLRMRAVGYDVQGHVVGEDEMVVNDPRPPFRVRLSAPAKLPESGTATMSAAVTRPDEIQVAGVDFYVGEEKVATATAAPYAASFDVAKHPNAI